MTARERAQHYLDVAAEHGKSSSDLTSTALVGLGFAVLALVDLHTEPDGYDFHELAGLARIWERDSRTAAEDLREWLHEQGLDPDALGDGSEDESDAAYERARDAEVHAFEEYGPK